MDFIDEIKAKIKPITWTYSGSKWSYKICIHKSGGFSVLRSTHWGVGPLTFQYGGITKEWKCVLSMYGFISDIKTFDECLKAIEHSEYD